MIGSSDTPLVHEDPIDPGERLSELEKENQTLRRQLDALQRETQSQSPTRSAKTARPQAQTALDFVSENSAPSGPTLSEKLNGPSLTKKNEVKTPGKKIRKFTARKWDFMDENEMDAYENM